MIKVLRFLILGQKYIRCNLFSWRQFSRDHLSEGQLCTRRIIQKTILLGGNSRGILSGSNYLWGNFLGAIIREQLSRGQLSWGYFFSGTIILGVSCLGDNYLGGNFPRGQSSSGQLSGGQLSRVQFSSGAIVLEPKNLARHIHCKHMLSQESLLVEIMRFYSSRSKFIISQLN